MSVRASIGEEGKPTADSNQFAPTLGDSKTQVVDENVSGVCCRRSDRLSHSSEVSV